MTTAEQNISVGWLWPKFPEEVWVTSPLANLSFKTPHLPPSTSQKILHNRCPVIPPTMRNTSYSGRAVTPSSPGKPGVNLWESRARWRLSQEWRDSGGDPKPPPAGTGKEEWASSKHFFFFLAYFWFLRDAMDNSRAHPLLTLTQRS